MRCRTAQATAPLLDSTSPVCSGSGLLLIAAVRFHQEHSVHAGAVILHGDGCRKLHKLLFTEMVLRLGVHLIGDCRRRKAYGFGNFKSRPFSRCEQRAVAPIRYACDFLVRTSCCAAPGSVGVNSERTGDHLRRPQTNQITQFSWQCIALAWRRTQRAAGLKDGGTAGLDTGGNRWPAGSPRGRLH